MHLKYGSVVVDFFKKIIIEIVVRLNNVPYICTRNTEVLAESAGWSSGSSSGS